VKIYGILYGFIYLNFALYIYCLALIRRFFPLPYRPEANLSANSPRVNIWVITPFFNEEDFIARKLQNITELDREGLQVQYIFVDSGSTDRSVARIQAFQQTFPQIPLSLLQSPARGKIAQLNYALARIKNPEDIVVVSDMDTVCESPRVLQLVLSYFRTYTNLGVLGAWVRPSESAAQMCDIAYWDKQNRLRYMEMIAYSASIVTGPFYAFQRGIFSLYPEDCVADDVYVSYVCHALGRRVFYVDDINCVELRQPATILGFLRHKLRKANAYTKELFRFLKSWSCFKKRMKFFYAFKLMQFVFLPIVAPVYLYSTFALLLTEPIFILSLSGFLLLSMLLASLLMIPPATKVRGGISLTTAYHSMESLVLINFVLILNLCSYPFWKQNSMYQRVVRS
jgi:cellulose synthase/poly-beta-1,6-N-acetylglucosamine synthase-like glycosyltransferase